MLDAYLCHAENLCNRVNSSLNYISYGEEITFVNDTLGIGLITPPHEVIHL